MLKRFIIVIPILCAGLVFGAHPMWEGNKMQLGNFSVSLTVKDIVASKTFYEKLGFTQVAGKLEQRWVVLSNGDTKIGLFQGMFDKNTLTFNPGWDSKGEQLESFLDVRDIQKSLLESGIELTTKADPNATGPAYIALVDPDGNPILIDQHVPKP
ncbi:MAG: VOC family protein [Pirellula sp.]|jgi:catechol 2,3-dioxygenase-like lactoylglutathione lyase family enzyme|nr:VOC family protein [Pirellula sp.]